MTFASLETTLDRALVIAFLGSLVFAGFKAYKGDLSRSGKIAVVICLLSFVGYVVKNPTALGDLYATVLGFFN